MEAVFNRMLTVGGGIMLSGVFLSQFVFVVDGGHRALKMDAVRGLQPHVYGEGMWIRVPFLQRI